MPEVGDPVGETRLGLGAWRWLIVSALIVGLDQLTKVLVLENLDLYQRVPVLGFFDIVRLHNTGAAFSFLADASGWQNWLFVGVAGVVSIAILWWLFTLPAQGRLLLATALALVLGGAIGNVIDRLNHGYVVDFLLFYYREWSYPAFNVADSAITCGVALLLFDGLVLDRRRQKSKPLSKS